MIDVKLTAAQLRSVFDGAEFVRLTEQQARTVRAKLNAAASDGRPRSNAPRCACGAMTLKRAETRGHKCR